MSITENILYYLWAKDDNSDKIYGAVEAAGHIFGFYGKRNPAENPKERSSLSVVDVGKNCETFEDELVEMEKILLSKIDKGYKPLYIRSDKVFNMTNSGFSAYGGINWNRRYIISKYGETFSDSSIINDIIENNYYNFEDTIKKKLSKKIMTRV